MRQTAYCGPIPQNVHLVLFVEWKEFCYFIGSYMPRSLKTLHLFFSETQCYLLCWIRFSVFLQLTQTRAPSKLRQNSLAQCWIPFPAACFLRCICRHSSLRWPAPDPILMILPLNLSTQVNRSPCFRGFRLHGCQFHALLRIKKDEQDSGDKPKAG